MKNLTFDQKIVNCITAMCQWNDVLPKTVNLRYWRCGTLACFGGHLATWDEFKAQGVSSTKSNPAPSLNGMEGSGVADYLFGNDEMFREAGTSELDNNPSAVSHHSIIINRLEQQLVRLTEEV